MKVLFYPDPPVQYPGHSMSKTIRYFQIMGFDLTNNINSDWDIAVHWDYDDINETPDKLLIDKRPVLNRNINNVTKSHVDKIFSEAFGYSSLADTSKYGYCVRKTNKQSRHDGKIIRMPCIKETGYVYQLFLDSRINMNTVCDIRIPIFLGEVPLLFLKCRGVEGTFENVLSHHWHYWVVQDLNDYLTKDEINKVIKFCKIIGLDVGEIDSIRDNSTSKIYLIDVNNLPGGAVFDHIENGRKVEYDLAMLFKEKLKNVNSYIC